MQSLATNQKDGMIKTESSTHIARPPVAVLGFVSDLSNRPRWDREVILAVWTSAGPIRAGSTYEVVTGFLGRKIQIAVEITGWGSTQVVGCQITQRAVSGRSHHEVRGRWQRNTGHRDVAG